MSGKVAGPDQARSWAMALAGFVINTLMSGISRASGLLYVAFLDNYGCTRQEANYPFTARNCVRNLCGPLVGIIGQRYGVRDVSIIGGVFASIGVVTCAFGSDIVWITAMWGGIFGCGVSLANTLFAITLNQYFVKYRATASGLALSGACFGSFGFPVAVERLLENYGLPSTFLIIGGLMMHAIPAAMILNEPPWLKKSVSNTSSAKPIPRNDLADQVVSGVPGKVSGYLENGSIKEIVVRSEKPKKGRSGGSDSEESIGRENPCYIGSKMDIRKGYIQQCQDDNSRIRSVSIGEVSIVYPSPDDPSQQELTIYKGIVRVVSDPMFHMISLTLAAFAMVFEPTITVIIDFIKDKGIDESNGKYLISMMSIGDLVGRLCFGWVTDKEFLSVPKFMLLTCVIQGTCIVILPFYDSFEIMMVLMIVYGLAEGAALVMFPILVAKYLTSVQSLAFGCTQFMSGVVLFAVPPLIGYFRDTVGSYDGMFIITGGMLIASGFVWLLEPLLMKLKFRSKHSASICIST